MGHRLKEELPVHPRNKTRKAKAHPPGIKGWKLKKKGQRKKKERRAYGGADTPT